MNYKWKLNYVGSIADIREKYKVDLEKIQTSEIRILKAIYKEGTKHLEYFYSSMVNFQFPERRIKTSDTDYYEKVMPTVIEILKAKGQIKI